MPFDPQYETMTIKGTYEQYPKAVVFHNMLPATDFPYAILGVWESGCMFDMSFSDLPNRKALDDEGPCAQEIMGDYYPEAVWCDKSTFMHGGWQACIKGR